MSVIRLDHPLIADRLAVIRDRMTPALEFRTAVNQLSGFLAYELAATLPTRQVTVQTPLAEAACQVVDQKGLVLAPILRAGLGLVPGVQAVFPTAPVVHLGFYRDEETLEPVLYYRRSTIDFRGRIVVVLDPMLATGGTAIAALDLIGKSEPNRVALLCLIASEEGLAAVTGRFPEADIFAAAIDAELNERGFIVPGLGDAGDRMFGTE